MDTHWPHAPSHWTSEFGSYMVTGGTFKKQHFFDTDAKRDLFIKMLFSTAIEFGWSLEAWALLSNHYHFVAHSSTHPEALPAWINKLHACSARDLNRADVQPGRKVWFQYWDTHLTHQSAYLARLAYVHHNPIKHGATKAAHEYRWCSASWFTQKADSAFVRTVQALPIDAVNVIDDF